MTTASSLSPRARRLCGWAVMIVLGPLASQSLAQQTLHRWNFAAGPDGWSGVHSVAPPSVREGRLIVKVVGFDPYIHTSRGDGLSIEGHPDQFIRMVARCNVKGGAEFFWASSTNGQDLGFRAGKEVHFTLHGDGKDHTYNVFPGWEGRVTGLRFDPPGGEQDGTAVEIKSIEILDLPASSRSKGPTWDFAGRLSGFVPAADIEDFRLDKDGAVLTGYGRSPMLRIGNLSLDADALPWLTLDATSSDDTILTVQWSDSDGTFLPGAQASIRILRGKSHHAVRLSDRANWRGSIGGLRLVWRADDHPVTMTFKKLAFAATPVGPPAAELVAVGFDRAVGVLRGEAHLGATVRNSGGETLHDVELKLLGGRKSQSKRISSLAPGEESKASFSIRLEQLGEVRYDLDLQGRRAGATSIEVANPLPKAAPDMGVEVSDTQAVMASAVVRLRAPVFRAGEYGPLFLEAKRDGKWRRLATLPAIGNVRGAVEVTKTDAATTARVSRLPDSPGGLTFQRTVNDEAGCVWEVAAEYRLSDDPHRIDVKYTLTAGRDGKVYRFDGPLLRVGDGTFGASKSEAVFPGLEYLSANEASSSDRDIAPPGDLRAVPHPNRVCIPVQAVASPDKDVVALLWDNKQHWFDDHDQPSALFASPNFVESGDARLDLDHCQLRSGNNHLLGLFLPSVPDFVSENGLIAASPVEMKKGQTLTLKSSLYVKPNAEVLDAVLAWHKRFKPEAIGNPPLSLKEHYALSLRAFEEILYTAGKGWAGVKGWTPSRNPGTALMYLYLAEELKRPALRQTAIERMRGVNALPLSLHLGGAASAVLSARAGGFGALSRREPDGNWVFRPTEKTKTLGKAGDTNVGMAAGSVRQILQSAALTADPRLLAEGLKGLEWMRKWRIPRGSQVWEIPLHAPDILASAHACSAFLWAYRLTGDRSYLDDAVYWAKTGLPFVYFWQTPEKGLEPMRGGTIPIFGATFYVGSWFGRLVQWCGLEYASVLLDLAEIDQSFDWRGVARDITVSGWRQQQSKEGYQGLYPDSWSMIAGDISWGLMLGPQRLIQCQLELDGRHSNGDVRLFRQGPNLVSLLAPGELGGVAAGKARDGKVVGDLVAGSFDLVFSHRFSFDAPAYVAIIGVTEPSRVLAEDQALSRAADLTATASGWSHDAELPGIVLKLPQRVDKPIHVALTGLRAAPVAVRRTRWTFDDGCEGWRAEHDLEPLAVLGGTLHCKPTGGDPYLTVSMWNVPAKDFAKVVIKCRLPQSKAGNATSLQVFWATQEGSFAPQRSAIVSIPADTGWHEVTVDLSKTATWRGMLTGLRIDPPGDGLEIDAVWLR